MYAVVLGQPLGRRPIAAADITHVSTGRGISSVWGVQFSPVGGLAISRLRDQRLHSLVVDRDALTAWGRKTVG